MLKRHYIISLFILTITYSCDPNGQLMYCVKNNTDNIIYVQKPCCDRGNILIQTIQIKNIDFVKIMPKSTELIFHGTKTGWPGDKELLNSNLADSLFLIKEKDTLKFIFADKTKCDIEIDGQIGNYIRVIE